MTKSSCKRDTKSKSHPGMKLAPVRVFSCKRPLRLVERLEAILSNFPVFLLLERLLIIIIVGTYHLHRNFGWKINCFLQFCLGSLGKYMGLDLMRITISAPCSLFSSQRAVVFPGRT